jgi:pimeloyl-ACP methyl ester carboxylesterase
VTLVLLPGLNGTIDLFASFQTAASASFKIIAVAYPDDPNLGYAELVEVARKSLPINEEFLIVGESFSGPIAISIAASMPPGLIGLVLCCTFSQNPRPSFSSLHWLPSLVPLRLIPSGVIARVLLGRYAKSKAASVVVATVRKISSSLVRARLLAISRVNVSKIFSTVKVPVLYLRARGDLFVPKTAADRLLGINTRLSIVEIDAPHFLLQTAPKEAASAIYEFLRRLKSAP